MFFNYFIYLIVYMLAAVKWTESYNVDRNEHETDYRSQLAKEMKSYMDESVDPCEDFYSYACGNFKKIYPVSRNGRGFMTLAIHSDYIQNLTVKVLEEIQGDGHDLNEMEVYKKAKKFYSSCVDISARKSAGIKPLLELFESLGGWHLINSNTNHSDNDWMDIIVKAKQVGVPVLVEVDISQDRKVFGRNAIYVYQANFKRNIFYSLNLNSTRDKAMSMLTSLGADLEKLPDVVEKIIDLERKITDAEQILSTNVYVDNYNKMTVFDLHQKVPNFDWQCYLTHLIGKRVNMSTETVLLSTEYIEKLQEIIESTEPQTIIDYAFWKIATTYSDQLVTEEVDEKTISQKCANSLKADFGRIVDSLFIRNYFDEDSKQEMEKIAQTIKKYFRNSLQESNWLTTELRQNVLQKLDHMKFHIGYPDFLLSEEHVSMIYKDTDIGEEFFKNIISIRKQAVISTLANIDKTSDNAEWDSIDVTTPNAHYVLSQNAIYTPAALLQPLFYHKSYPVALKYGRASGFIGHEIMHAFGKLGRSYDYMGIVQTWWEKEDDEKYEAKGQCLRDQYNKYTVSGHKVDGKFTEDENAADIAGLKAAYHAYQQWIESNRHNNEIFNTEQLPGIDLTTNQLFFLVFAQNQCTNLSPQVEEIILKIDSHTFGYVRVNGTLANSYEFASTFSCKNGTAMNPERKCTIW